MAAAPAGAIRPEPMPAAAQAGYGIAVPDGWEFKPGLADGLARNLAGQRHYDGKRTEIGADAYVFEGGGALYVAWIHAVEPSDRTELAVRRTFDQIRRSPSAASPLAKSAELVSWREEFRDELADGRLEWRHLSNETTTVTRVLIHATPDKLLRQVRAECVMNHDAVATVRPMCEAALASLAVATPVAERGALGAVPSAGELRVSDGDGGEAVIEVDGKRHGDAPRLEAPSMRPPDEAGGRIIYTGDAPAPESGGTNRWLVLGGAVLLIAGLYLTMRQRGGGGDERSNDPERRDEQ